MPDTRETAGRSTLVITARSIAAALALALPVACASVDPRPDFDTVARSVAERSGEEIRWEDAGPDSERVRRVHELLAAGLDERSAVRIALENSPRLRALYEDLGIARAEVARASRPPNPLVDAEVRFPEGGGGSALELSIVEDFVGLLTLPLSRRLAEDELEATRLHVTREVLATIAEVRGLLRDWQAAEQLVELEHTVLEAMMASRDLAERIHAAGNSRALDLASERVQAEEARLALAAAQTRAALARTRIDAALGLWGSRTEWNGPPRLAEIPDEAEPLDRAESRAIESSLDLAIARVAIQAGARELGIAERVRFLAEGELGIAAERESDGGHWTIGPSATIPLPIFDGGGPAIAAARARIRQRAQLYAAEAIEVRAEARAFATALLHARARATHLRDSVLPLRRKVVEEAQLQYNAMQISAFELLQARRDEIEAGREWIESVRDYWKSRDGLELLWSGARPRTRAPIPGSGPETDQETGSAVHDGNGEG